MAIIDGVSLNGTSYAIQDTPTHEAVAEEFDATENYTAGKSVWHNGVLYRFTDDHPAGTWTGTDAIAVTVCGDIADLKSAFGAMGLVIYNGQFYVNPDGNTLSA